MKPTAYTVLRAFQRAWILRCRTCKAHRRVEPGETLESCNKAPHVVCCENTMVPNMLKARFVSDVVCSAICTGAKGHTCDCSCGGKNHGAKA